ncbi:MAG: hypothetical protein GXO15_00515 [Crenarchaeota archaeon]|nr:hypothetical protein [Thermoproteota archaeon]
MPEPEELLRLAGVGRFQVMALLQAARHYLLHGDLDKAKSWGLNRAIFYAWAKHYGPRRRPITLEELERRASRRGSGKCPEGFREELGECVQVSPRGYYMIGGEEQTPQRFDLEAKRRIEKLIPWEKAWKAALEYVSSFPREVLENPQRFYKLVYEPVRDTFFATILRGEKPRPPREAVKAAEQLARAEAERKSKQLPLDAFIRKRGSSS